MDTTTVLHSFTPPSTVVGLTRPSSAIHTQNLLTCRLRHRFLRICATNSSKDTPSASSSSSTDAAPPVQPKITPPDAVEIRFRRGSRRRSRQQQQDGGESKNAAPPPRSPKKWEEMSIAEKAIELYVGEKGVLFWLNKFAYASIFIMIGAWIIFRFVGPALNLYQLDTPPLAPEAVFKGS